MKEKGEIIKSFLLLSLLTFIIIISIFIFIVPANAGVSPYVGRSIGDNVSGFDAIIGETNLSFVNATGVLIPRGKLKGTWDDSIPIQFPNKGNVFDSSIAADLVKGEYNVIGDNGKSTTVDFYLPKLNEPFIPTEVNGDYFEWVTRGGEIILKAYTNLDDILGPMPNNISFRLLDPRGERVYEVNGVTLYDISVDSYGDKSLPINTTGMRTGVYTLSIETDRETNNGLDTEGPQRLFEVKSKGVEIVKPDPQKPEEKKATITEEMLFKFSTTPNTHITLNVTWGMPSKVYFKNPKSEKVVLGGRSNSKGELEIDAYFDVTGSFEITATEHICNTTDSIFVEIVPYTAELTKPKEGVHYIGLPIKIEGEVNAGVSVTIKIEDEIFDIVLRDGNRFEASKDWNTEDKSPGKYEIAIWVSPFSNPETDPPDDSVTIILIRGGLFAKTSADFVARDDDFEIEGAVPGRDRVDILTIAPKGGSGKGFNSKDIFNETNYTLDAPGLTYSTCGVDTDGTFKTDKIPVDKDIDTGIYLIAVLNYGRDGEWGRSGSNDLLKVISNGYSTPLEIKTADQIIEILKDRTINAAGSDDLLDIATIKVEEGFVTLDPVEDVPLGSDFEVGGITNRKVGDSIIVTVEGLGADAAKLKPKIADVVAGNNNFNKFTVSFSTVTARIGKYMVTADDGDGHTDTTTVNILMAVEPSVNVSATPIPTPTPIVESEGKSESAAATPLHTPTPTAIEETEKQPGFELVFSIAGVFVATWLMLRMRLRQRKDKKR